MTPILIFFIGVVLLLIFGAKLSGIRFIPNNRIGLVETPKEARSIST